MVALPVLIEFLVKNINLAFVSMGENDCYRTSTSYELL